MSIRFSLFKLLVVENDLKQQRPFYSIFGHEFAFDFVREPEDIILRLEPESTPDLIIMNGKTDLKRNLLVVKEIQKLENISPVAIWINAGSISRNDRIKAHEAGVLDVLGFSANPEETKLKISALLGFLRQREAYTKKAIGHKLVNAMGVPSRRPLGEQHSLEERIELSKKLSTKEKKLLILLLGGSGYKEISYEFGLKYEAGKKMVHRFYKKYGVSGKIDLLENIDRLL